MAEVGRCEGEGIARERDEGREGRAGQVEGRYGERGTGFINDSWELIGG